MATFQDAAGRVWHVRITVATVRRVNELLGLDLLQLAGGPLIAQLSTDPSTLADVLYVVCKPQADAEAITAEAFADQIAGDVIDRATEALLNAMVDFLPESRRRLLTKAREKFAAATAATMTKAEAMLDAIDLEDLVNQARNASHPPPPTSSLSATPTPELLGSTPPT
jgi:hypothetical protein